ncbi:hypothetical protein Pmar_PMAR015407 [Perkinsus marinus ATCC 50983]|uniref:Uncharacterized protein n=1 Tax=Perkinsus marinus (strain ATCC 50983 / TXsc) TaxID=423536 RepID=C5LQC4_PERM5|nr:hypothetical protein Pmar_PMAR015407 [Perkinsus marinus ATCC 50983]EER01069.1 hypothetical protein Pmar_PMAR015407 [Perkinsus marinus ATCC 50983]|eukprot:XP_002768351.1 hypothetical protein Pmar_PMAR015407 [Perkinsus marinus ATCC 50983]
METFDMVLPLMDDGSLTILEDIYVVKDGQVSVVSWPSRPYQYIVYFTTPTERRILQIYGHGSYVIEDEPVKSVQTFGKHRNLRDDGWEYKGIVMENAVKQTLWVSTGGLPTGGGGEQEFDLLGAAEVAPNKWKLYLDETNTTLTSIEGVGGSDDTVLQRTTITFWADLAER